MSFQCLVVGEGDGKPTHATVRVGDAELVVRAMRAPVDTRVAAYRHVARLLSGGSYAGPAGDVEVTAAEAAPTAADLGADDMRLASLELLREADPFLGHDWPLADDTLRDVYPLQLHLGNFTDVFRNRYRRERGRL